MPTQPFEMPSTREAQIEMFSAQRARAVGKLSDVRRVLLDLRAKKALQDAQIFRDKLSKLPKKMLLTKTNEFYRLTVKTRESIINYRQAELMTQAQIARLEQKIEELKGGA